MARVRYLLGKYTRALPGKPTAVLLDGPTYARFRAPCGGLDLDAFYNAPIVTPPDPRANDVCCIRFAALGWSVAVFCGVGEVISSHNPGDDTWTSEVNAIAGPGEQERRAFLEDAARIGDEVAVHLGLGVAS